MQIEANWSLTQEMTEKLYGRLVIDDFGEAILYLPSAFQRSLSELLDLTEYKFIYGISNDGFIVLENCHEVQYNVNSNSTMTIDKVYIFKDQTMFENVITKCSISFDRLGAWVNENAIEMTYLNDEEDENKVIGIQASAKRSVVIWEGQITDFILRFIIQTNTRTESSGVSFISKYYMEVEFTKPFKFSDSKCLENAFTLIEQLNMLLNICIGEDVYTNTISFTGEDIVLNIHQYSMINDCYNKSDNSTLNINFTKIKDDFCDLVKVWIDNYEKFLGSAKIIRKFILDTGRRKRIIDIPTLMKDVCVGIESYSRNITELKTEDDLAVYQERYGRIRKATESTPQDVKWLNEKLKYANEASLRKMLKVLFGDLLRDFPSLSFYLSLQDKKSRNNLIDQIVKTRNFYTHWDLKSKKNIYNDKEAYSIAVIIIEIIRILILKSCQVPIEILDSFAKENQILIKNCADMGFIVLNPPMIFQALPEISSNLYWFITSFFSDIELTYNFLKKENISCLITVDEKYEKDTTYSCIADKTFFKYDIKLDENATSRIYGLIDKNISDGNKVAIWLSNEIKHTALKKSIEKHYAKS